MPYNGSGSFTPYTPGNPVVTGTVISSTAFNATQQDIAAGLSNAVTRDGQSPLTANIPAAGRKLTGLGAGVVAGDSLRWEQLFSQGAEQDIASAATTDIGALNTTIVRVTGTTTITSFGTNYNGPRFVRFAGALTLTHNATTLILPGGANITTAAGDAIIAVPVGNPSSGWRVMSIMSATDAEAQAGTLAGKFVTPDNLSATVLGMGQTWQDLTASRALGTTYTNSTGRPIFATVTVVAAAGAGNVDFTVAGVPVGVITQPAGLNAHRATISFVVPNGATYVGVTTGPTLFRWSELR